MYQNKTQLTGGDVTASPQRDPFGTKRTANIAGRNYQPGGFHLKYALACILFTVQKYGKNVGNITRKKGPISIQKDLPSSIFYFFKPTLFIAL